LPADETARAAGQKSKVKTVASAPDKKLYSPPVETPKPQRQPSPEEILAEAWWSAFENIEQPGQAKACAPSASGK
jgi:hypothetical protein